MKLLFLSLTLLAFAQIFGSAQSSIASSPIGMPLLQLVREGSITQQEYDRIQEIFESDRRLQVFLQMSPRMSLIAMQAIHYTDGASALFIGLFLLLNVFMMLRIIFRHSNRAWRKLIARHSSISSICASPHLNMRGSFLLICLGFSMSTISLVVIEMALNHGNTSKSHLARLSFRVVSLFFLNFVAYFPVACSDALDCCWIFAVLLDFYITYDWSSRIHLSSVVVFFAGNTALNLIHIFHDEDIDWGFKTWLIFISTISAFVLIVIWVIFSRWLRGKIESTAKVQIEDSPLNENSSLITNRQHDFSCEDDPKHMHMVNHVQYHRKPKDGEKRASFGFLLIGGEELAHKLDTIHILCLVSVLIEAVAMTLIMFSTYVCVSDRTGQFFEEFMEAHSNSTLMTL